MHTREDVSPAEGESKYGSDADFLDETNKKYPTDTPEHMRAAASYLGMPKNSEKYTGDELSAMRSKLRQREAHFGIGSR